MCIRDSGQAAEQLLQVVREVGAAGVARVHGDEDGHVWVDLHLTTNQLHSHGGTWQTEMATLHAELWCGRTDQAVHLSWETTVVEWLAHWSDMQ